MEGFWAKAWHVHFEQIEMGPFYGLFMLSGCIALLITLGAILGKVDFSQMLFVSVFEMIMFSLNEHIVLQSIKAKDQGGAMFIHTFGSTFGVLFNRFFVLGFIHPVRILLTIPMQRHLMDLSQ